jgi:hemolysin activation/secretion protein
MGFRKKILAQRIMLISTAIYPLVGVAAPNPPSSGAIVQPSSLINHQQSNLSVEQEPQRALVRQEPATVATEDDSSLQGKIRLKQIQFKHDLTAISDQELQAQVASYLGKTYKLSEFKKITANLEHWLQTEHKLIKAKVWVPLQEVDQGVVQLQITQGTIAEYLVSAHLKDQFTGNRLIALAEKNLPKGSAVTQAALEHIAYKTIDYTNQPVQIVLMPSATVGQYKVLLDVAPAKKMSGSVSVDNTGNRYTNQWRDASIIVIDNPLGFTDKLQLSAQLLTPNQHSVLARYEIPTTTGLRFGVEAQYSDYELVGVFKPLEAKGDTKSIFADVNYNLMRSRTLSGWVGASVKHWNGENEQLGTITTDRKLNSLSLNTTWQWSNIADHYARLELTGGNADLTDIPADRKLDRATARISDDYYKLNADYSVKYPIDPRSSARLLSKAQIAKKNLESNEKLSMGGLTGIRAYPYGEGLGDTGLVAQTEYNYLLRPDIQLGAFYDLGYVRRNADPWTGLTGDNKYFLHGVGGSVTWQPIAPLSLKLITAAKLGNNAGADANDKDSDGRDSRVRAWLVGSWTF